MMKLCTILYLLTISLSFGSIDNEIYNNNGHLSYLSGKLCDVSGNIEFNVKKYLYSIRYKIGDINIHDYYLTKNNLDINNIQHLVFNQTYNGIPVFGKNIRVHIDNNMIVSLSSNIKNITLSVVPLITKEESIDIIEKQIVSQSDYLQFYKTQIYIYNTIPHLVE